MLKEVLVTKKQEIVGAWIGTLLESYPTDSLSFLKSQKNRFANPIGYTISCCAEKVFDELTGSCDSAKIKTLLTDMIKMRAVQEFLPSQAIGFIFDLKRVIRDQVGKEIEGKEDYDCLTKLESQVDAIALIAFDLYMESREKLFHIRLDELRAKSFHETLQRISERRAT